MEWALQLGAPPLRRPVPTAFHFEGQWALLSGEPEGCGKQIPLLKGAHRLSHAPGQKQSIERSLGQTHLLTPEGEGWWQTSLPLSQGRWHWHLPLWNPPSLSAQGPRPTSCLAWPNSTSISTGTPQAKQLARQRHSPPTHQQTCCLKTRVHSCPTTQPCTPKGTGSALDTRVPGLAPGSPGPCSQRPWDPAPPTSGWHHPWGPLGPSPTVQWADNSPRTTAALQPAISEPSSTF